MREETQEGTVMPLADNVSASSNHYEPRVLVKFKYAHGRNDERYALWIFEPKDWEPSSYYQDHWEIIAWAYTPEEREALNATVEYHTNLMKENQDAKD